MIRQRLSVEFGVKHMANDGVTAQDASTSKRETQSSELPGQANICGEQGLESHPSVDKRCVVVAGIAEITIVVVARAIELVVKRVRHT